MYAFLKFKFTWILKKAMGSFEKFPMKCLRPNKCFPFCGEKLSNIYNEKKALKQILIHKVTEKEYFGECTCHHIINSWLRNMLVLIALINLLADLKRNESPKCN